MSKERRHNVSFTLFITFAVLIIIGVILFAVGAYGEAVAAQARCEVQNLMAVQKAISGYVCVEVAP